MQIGTAYYPEHWPRERWREDLALMREAGIGLIRIAEFAWCRIEPRDGVWEWAWLDAIIELAHAHDIGVLLCTPTQAPPNWLSRDHPDILVGLPDGSRFSPGGRAHCDAASPSFRFFADRVTRQLGERYGRDQRVVGWQLHNEIGAHSHFVSHSPAFLAAFRSWLRRRYDDDLERLNQRWGTVFWSGEYDEWSSITMPGHTGAGANPALRKCLREFGQWLWCDFLTTQAAILRPLCPEQFITHNLAWFGEQVDVWRLREFCDVAGIDNYKSSSPVVTCAADLYRAARGSGGWAVLETNGQEGVWQTDDAAGPATGSLRSTLVRYAIAGARFTSLFRFQTAPCGAEQNHHAGLRDAWGRPCAATITGCREATAQIARLQDFLARPRHERVGIVWDTDNLIWAEMHPIEGRPKIPHMGSYCFELLELQQACHRLGLRAGFTNWQADWSDYELVIVWNHCLAEAGDAERLAAHLAGGGSVLANHLYGFQNRDGRRQPLPLPLGATELFGCSVDTLLPLQRGGGPRLAIGDQVLDPTEHGCALRLDGGEALGHWRGWSGEHDAALVRRRHGSGAACYFGGTATPAILDRVLASCCSSADIGTGLPISAAPQVEIIPDRDGFVVVNNGHIAHELTVDGAFENLVDGAVVSDTLRLPGYALAVLVPTGN